MLRLGHIGDIVEISLKLHTAYLNIFFHKPARVLKPYKYVEIKQLSKVNFKQNNSSTIILLIKYSSINEIRTTYKEVALFT